MMLFVNEVVMTASVLATHDHTRWCFVAIFIRGFVLVPTFVATLGNI